MSNNKIYSEKDFEKIKDKFPKNSYLSKGQIWCNNVGLLKWSYDKSIDHLDMGLINLTIV